MRRMLDPKEAGGNLPSTIQFDEEGNRTVGKDLKVDGKLKLKSLVSESNPDGDITKELGKGGGGFTLYQHCITLYDQVEGYIVFDYYTSRKERFTSVSSILSEIENKAISCSGIILQNGEAKQAVKITVGSIQYISDPANISTGSYPASSLDYISDFVSQVA